MSGWTGKKVISLFNIISLLMKKNLYLYKFRKNFRQNIGKKRTKRKTDVMSKTYQG